MNGNTKVITVQLPERINPKTDRQEKILCADIDNKYYQRMENLISCSGRLYRCVETQRKFLQGRAFKEEKLKKMIVNNRGYTLFNLFAKCCKDKIRTGGFAIQINYNANYNAVEFNYIPFKYIRLCIDEKENLTGQYAVYEDWGKCKWKQIRKEKIKILDRFNSDPLVIEAQVTHAGSWEKWNGQIIWCSPEIDSYPLVPFDSEIESAETDFRIKRFKLKNVSTNFMASYLLTIMGNYSEPEKDKIIDDFESFQGDENAGKLMALFAKDISQIPKLEKFDLQNNDRLFEWHETSVDERIRKTFGIPPVILGDLVGGRMGTAREMADAINIMNQLVIDTREEVINEFQKILPLWIDSEYQNIPIDVINLKSWIPIDVPKELYSDLTHAQRLEMIGVEDDHDVNHVTDGLAATLGPKGTSDFVTLMTSTMTPDQKIQSLMQLYNWSEDVAKKVVGVILNPTP